MKKILIFVTIVICAIFSSCKKDEPKIDTEAKIPFSVYKSYVATQDRKDGTKVYYIPFDKISEARQELYSYMMQNKLTGDLEKPVRLGSPDVRIHPYLNKVEAQNVEDLQLRIEDSPEYHLLKIKDKRRGKEVIRYAVGFLCNPSAIYRYPSDLSGYIINVNNPIERYNINAEKESYYYPEFEAIRWYDHVIELMYRYGPQDEGYLVHFGEYAAGLRHYKCLMNSELWSYLYNQVKGTKISREPGNLLLNVTYVILDLSSTAFINRTVTDSKELYDKMKNGDYKLVIDEIYYDVNYTPNLTYFKSSKKPIYLDNLNVN